MRRDYSPKDVFRLFDFAFVVDDEESTIVALQVAREASVMLADLFAPIDETFNLLNPRTVAAVGCSGDGGLALLLRLLDEGGRRIRLSVAAALGFVGGPGAREALERVAREPDDSLREVAIRALGTLPAEYQFKRLADITPRSRVIAALILRDQVQLDFREVAPLVVHPCEKIRDAARHAIIAGGTTDAIDTVFEIFAHRGAPLDTESVLFLGRTRDLRAIPPLLSTAASDEPESMVRDECIALLRKFPRARADVIAAVTRSFVDNPLVRRREGELIGKLVGANAIPVLLEGLKDVYRAVRENAARGLVAVGRDAVPHLLDLLQTPMASLDFRSEVIQILGEIGDSRALDAVEAMLPVVRDAAIRSLSGFRTVRAFDILQRLISVPATRQQAWASFKKLAANSRNSDSAHLLNVLEALLCLPDARIREDVFELFETLMYRRVPTESIIQSLLPALAKSDPELEKAVIAWLSKRPESNRPLVAAALQSANSLLQPPLRAALRAIDDAIAEEEQRQREYAAAEEQRRRERAGVPTPRPGEERGTEAAAIVASLGNEPSQQLPFPITDDVKFSVSAPLSTQPGENFVLGVWVHPFSKDISKVARQQQRGKATHVDSRGPVRLAPGSELDVDVSIPDFHLHHLKDTMLWSGQTPFQIGNCMFPVTVPSEVKPGNYLGTAIFRLGNLRVTRLVFSLQVGPKVSLADDVTSHVARFQRAFASYSTEDRVRVLARVQGMLEVLPELDIFLDVMSLRAGEKWEERVTEEILARDVFLLFWSVAASQSKWVEHEWRTALHYKGLDSISPVPLDPAGTPPPPELASLHFNDFILSLASSERE